MSDDRGPSLMRTNPAQRCRPQTCRGGRPRVTPDVERDALTVKGDLSERVSLSMNVTRAAFLFYRAVRLAPSRWAFGLHSASSNRDCRFSQKTRRRSGSPPSDRDRFAIVDIDTAATTLERLLFGDKDGCVFSRSCRSTRTRPASSRRAPRRGCCTASEAPQAPVPAG